MKTIIEYYDGARHEYEDAAPSLDIEIKEDRSLILIDATCGNITDPIPLRTIKRIIFEPQS